MDIDLQCQATNEAEVKKFMVNYLYSQLTAGTAFVSHFFSWLYYNLGFLALMCLKLFLDSQFMCLTRYHYNVADIRLAQHIERGIADGLLISCVSSCSNLWALIMDAGTGFTNQVYELSPVFLHKVV